MVGKSHDIVISQLLRVSIPKRELLRKEIHSIYQGELKSLREVIIRHNRLK